MRGLRSVHRAQGSIHTALSMSSGILSCRTATSLSRSTPTTLAGYSSSPIRDTCACTPTCASWTLNLFGIESPARSQGGFCTTCLEACGRCAWQDVQSDIHAQVGSLPLRSQGWREEADLEVGRAGDDMGVGDNVAVGVPDGAAARALRHLLHQVQRELVPPAPPAAVKRALRQPRPAAGRSPAEGS